MRRNLRPYQKRVFRYTKTVPHPALFLEMRLGKTLITVRRIIADSKPGRVLIVAPYSALDGWERELRMEGVSFLDIQWLTRDYPKEIKSTSKFILMNKEGFRRIPEVGSIRWAEVVMDESTFCKAPPGGSWSKRFGSRPNISRYYTEHFRNVKRRWILTGTPMPESELDIFMQLKFLDPSILPFDNYYEFKFKCFTETEKYRYELNDRGKEIFKTFLPQRCSFLKRQDVEIDVKKIPVRRICKLSAKARKMYETARREFILEHGDEVIDVTEYAIEVFTWLRRLAGGFLDGFHFMHKVDTLVEIVRTELAHEPVVVWCNFIQELTFIKQRLTKESISCEFIHGGVSPRERPKIYNRFKSGGFRVLVCQPETMKYGVNLDHCDTQIFYSLPLGYETYEQVRNRIINVGKRSILEIYLLTERTVDEQIYNGIVKKESRQEILHNIARSILKGS